MCPLPGSPVVLRDSNESFPVSGFVLRSPFHAGTVPCNYCLVEDLEHRLSVLSPPTGKQAGTPPCQKSALLLLFADVQMNLWAVLGSLIMGWSRELEVGIWYIILQPCCLCGPGALYCVVIINHSLSQTLVMFFGYVFAAVMDLLYLIN